MIEENKNHPEEHYNYKLKGIIIHQGTAEGGHYYSMINTIRDNKERKIYESDIWLEFND
jgi:ubiquitin C-terminal hydrolase